MTSSLPGLKSIAPEPAEAERLRRLYDRLRERLLDLSNRNPMLNYRMAQGSRSRRHLQVVDEVLDAVYQRLVGDNAAFGIDALEEPATIPADERTEDFVAAFQHAKASDVEYLTQVALLEKEGRDDEHHLGEAEQALRLRVRAELGLPARPKRDEIPLAEYAKSKGIDPSPDLPPSSDKPTHRDNVLQTLKYPDELEATLDRIADDARLATQETGLSTLFLAFGFLERTESDDSERRLFAPLLLLPVKLEATRVHGRSAYRLSATSGGAEINVSLAKLLEQERGRALPEFDTDEDHEAGGIEGYFERVTKAIDGLKRWRIRRWLVLGQFAFGRVAIYNDLAEDRWRKAPSTHRLVGALLAGTDRAGQSSVDFDAPEDYQIDSPEIEQIAPHLVADADASQHSALVDALKGVDLVIEGPPGTGKSQTITNIIANAIAGGKRVLFLAEKQAALNVVKQRLDRAGLGPFCLELHSEKAVPRLVVKALAERIDLGWGRPAPTKVTSDPVLDDARRTLAHYLADLHREAPDGETPFRLMWQAIRGSGEAPAALDVLRSVAPSIDWLDDLDTLAQLFARVEIYARAAAAFEAQHGPVDASPWNSIGLAEIPVYDFQRLRAALIDWRAPMLDAALLERAGQDLGLVTLADLAVVVAVDPLLGEPGGIAYLDIFAPLDMDAVDAVLTARERLAALEAVMQATPELDAVPVATTARAAELVQSRFGPSLFDTAPAELGRGLMRRSEEAAMLISTVAGLLPAAAAIGLDRDLPGDTFAALAGVCRIIAAFNGERRARLLAFGKVDAERLAAACARFDDLAEAERAWAAQCPGYDRASRPSPEQVRATAVWLRQGLGSRMIGYFGEGARAARAVLARLGVDRNPPSPDVLDQFADFLTFLRAFETDRGLADLFGIAFVGLSTQLGDIEQAVALRDRLAAMLAQLPGGASVAQATFAAGGEGLEKLADLAPVADRFASLGAALQARLTAYTIGSAVPGLEAEIRAADALQDLTGDSDLMGIELPLGTIAAFHAARQESAQLGRTVTSLPLWDRVSQFVGVARPEEPRAALAWIRAVSALPLGAEASASLLGPRAVDARRSLAQLASGAAAILRRLADVRTATEREFGSFNLHEGEPTLLLAQIDRLIAHHAQLNDVLTLRRHKLDIAAAGLGAFVDTAQRLRIPSARLLPIFATLAADRRADQAWRRSRALGHQTGLALDVSRRTFAERDRLKIDADRDMLRARLLQPRPLPGSNSGPKALWTEMALIRNEIAKIESKSPRHPPIRSLIARAGKSVQSLMPCFMMSPLSLAKFTTPGEIDFDLVVIDEASQMRPEDALGGLLRARQIVVVGDAKQLPPTDFFTRSGLDAATRDEDAGDIEGESILEFCRMTFQAVRRLKWHYRSRCESLIAFSNREFYDNGLITFPSPTPQSFSVDLVRVDGHYQNSRNPDEAARVAEEAIGLMRTFAEAEDADLASLGIVALNTEQRDLIQEELHRLQAGDDQVARYRERMERRGEPVFVKNLENVQGDERDFIFISLTYGPVPGSRVVAQRFGPIAGVNGHRRLNVLFTRARKRIAVFASFGSADVKLAETTGQGPRVLKRYLAYAEERGKAPVEAVGGEVDSDFEREVADRLVAAGFEVDIQVGVSSYRIDLGIRHPDRPEAYLAGVECDGARYHSSHSARDRDRLREEVLKGLGWTLVRVWSTDWFANPEQETERLVRRLTLLRLAPVPASPTYAVTPRGSGNPPADAPAPLPIAGPDAALPAEPALTQTVGEQLHLFEATPQNGLVDSVSEGLDSESISEDRDPMAVEMPGAALIDGDAPLTAQELGDVLVAFRETRIRPAIDNWQRQRSILRDGMIETFVAQRLVDPDDWFRKIPSYQRQGTSGQEKRLFLETICGLVARLKD